MDENGFTLYLSVLFVIPIIFLIIVIIYLRKKNKELTNKVKYIYAPDVDKNAAQFEDKELFLAKISHELRAPMSAVLGLSNILLQSPLNTIQYNNVSKIKHSSEMLIDIIDDILDISKIDAGKLRLERIKFDINEVLEHVSNMVSLKAKEKGLELTFNVDKSVPLSMIGDPLRLGQILINLLDNAIKFTDEGSIEVNINTIHVDYTGEIGLEFRIIDHGIGMSEKQLSEVFKEFSQFNESTSRMHGGIGLGLTITKELVNMMDGSIDIKSEEGEGTEIIVKIHLTKYDVNNKRSYRLPSKSLMDKKVVIVARGRSIESLSEMLRYFHYEVVIVSSLEWAEDFLGNESYDIIFIDENIFLETPISLVQNIKKRYNLKVVLIESIYYQNNDEVKNLEEIDNYLLRPFNQNVVYNLILDIYGEHGEAGSNSEIKREDFSVYKDIHILVAMSDMIDQKLLEDLLKETGFRLTMANSEKELMDRLEEFSNVSLILFDMDTKAADAYEIVKNIKSMPQYGEIPIYALMKNTQKRYIDKAKQSGIEDCIFKPLNVDSVYTKLFNLFNEMDKKKKEENKVKSQDSKVYVYRELDVNYGLEHSNNDSRFYERQLLDFKNIYSDANEILDSIVTTGLHHNIEKFIHDLKSFSSNIGGHKLSNSASKLEEAIKNHTFNKNSILLNRLKRDIDMFLKDIDKYMKSEK